MKKKVKKLHTDIEGKTALIEQTVTEKSHIEKFLFTYYEADKLKEEYIERTDVELINQFKKGALSNYKSEDIILRATEFLTVLDKIRKEVVWE